MNTFIYIILALVAVCTICTVIVMVKVFSRQETTSDVSSKDFDRLESKISEENRNARQELSDNIDKIRKELSDNVGKTREELSDNMGKMRDELSGNVGKMREEISGTVDKLRSEFTENVSQLRKESSETSKNQREETKKAFTDFQTAFGDNVAKLNSFQKEGFDDMGKRNKVFADTMESKLETLKDTTNTTLTKSFEQFFKTFDANTDKSVEAQNAGFEKMEKRQSDLIKTTENKLDTLRSIVEEKLTTMSEKFQEGFEKNTEKMVEAQKERFAEMDKRQSDLIQTTEKRLDEMRATVDEKLQKTLNDRLGQSFKLVSEQLESVQKGLGEMKNLASDVGGLKNALTNVKVRGNFGELQLKALLEQMLSPEQYDENVATVPGSSERVEFAIKLPGKDDPHGSVYLPIDSKFPKDVYDQYVDAIDTGDASAIKSKSSQFENTILAMAKDISTKYIFVPDTTNFAIMFVPVENIYAEVIRRSSLTQELRDKWNVLVTGPTTLGALLSSLQMGFRTLAIEKRSNDVWTTLGAVKTEFSKFGDLLEKAKKNIDTASATIEQLQGTRTKAINRKLREVEALPTDQAAALLPDMNEEGVVDDE
jgi:DNA recombination protein RmuC